VGNGEWHQRTSVVISRSYYRSTVVEFATVRNLLMAWVLTLPVSIALAGGLYWLLRNFL